MKKYGIASNQGKRGLTPGSKNFILLYGPGAFVFILLSWASRSMLGYDPTPWYVGLTLTGLTVFFWILGFILEPRLKRAKHQHLFISILLLPLVLILFDSSLRMIISVFMVAKQILYITFFMGLSLFVVSQLQLWMIRLNKVEELNLQSGRLKEDKDNWKLFPPLLEVSTEKEGEAINRWKFLNWVSPFLPFLGVMASRTLEGPVHLLFYALILNFLAFMWAYILGKNAGFWVYLRNKEKELGKPILLVKN